MNPLPFKPRTDYRTKTYLSANDLMQLLDISHGTAYRLMHAMPHIQIGKVLRVTKDALEKHLGALEKKGATPLLPYTQ